MKLATHFKRSKTVGFQFSSRASPDGFSIERYEKKREYFSLSAVKFESRALRFSGGKLILPIWWWWQKRRKEMEMWWWWWWWRENNKIVMERGWWKDQGNNRCGGGVVGGNNRTVVVEAGKQ